MNDKQNEYGARIERGRVYAVKSNGYMIESYSRYGIITPPLQFRESSLNVGEIVYFFLFEDGSGLIIDRAGD